MIARRWRRIPGLTSLVLSLFLILLAGLVGSHIALDGISYREVVEALVAVAGIAVLMAGERGLQIGMIVWVLTLGLGYRTIRFTPYLSLHPSELVLLGLLVFLFARGRITSGPKVALWIPRWLWLLMFFGLWAWIPGFASDRPWDQMFAEFRDFLLLIPLFIVTSAVLNSPKRWREALLAFYLTGVWIAGFGLLEYLFPGVATALPGFVSNPIPGMMTDGFLRAQFSFWGSPIATLVCLLAVPVAIAAWTWWSSFQRRLLILLAMIVLMAGVYIGGYRSFWLMLALMLLLWILLRRGPILAALSLIPAAIGYQFLPEVAQERAMSLILAYQGHAIDSSALDRQYRAMKALDMVLRQPLGVGWAGAGWVHSDFLQVAANLGVLAGLLFAGAYALTLWRTWHRIRQYPAGNEQGAIGMALFLSFFSAGAILLQEGVEVLPQLALPVWFVWVLVEVWLRQDDIRRRTEQWRGSRANA